MSRHSRALQQLAERVHDGKIGEIILQRGYRMHGPGGYFSSLPKPDGISDLLYQVQRFHSFIWASGGCFNDFYIHFVDQSVLDEERVARESAGAGRPPLPRESGRNHVCGSEFRYVLGGIYLLRWIKVLSRWAHHRGMREDLCELPARHQRDGNRFQGRRLRSAVKPYTKAR